MEINEDCCSNNGKNNSLTGRELLRKLEGDNMKISFGLRGEQIDCQDGAKEGAEPGAARVEAEGAAEVI